MVPSDALSHRSRQVNRHTPKAAGTAIPSYTSELLSRENLDAETESNIKWSAASLYAGGGDTTVSFLHSFFLAMQLYPEVQRKAQEEIDRVVGTDRLPVIADRPNLPYIEAIIKELLRWNPVAPLGTYLTSSFSNAAERSPTQVSHTRPLKMIRMRVTSSRRERL